MHQTFSEMKSKYFLQRVLLFVMIVQVFSIKATFGQDSISATKQAIREKLSVPFGTISKMNIEIVDGDELHDKYHQGSFLIKIKSVDSLPLSVPVIIEFKDETGNFPGDGFELYKKLYGKKTGTISSGISTKMKKKYVGRGFNIAAYETGEFTGIPNEYYKYQPERQDYGFHFRNYIIIVGDLTKGTK